MTTVNKLIRQIAAEQAPELPLLELTNTDQDLIARLATELLSVATSRVGQLMAERETMLKRRAEEAEARAATAISVADNEVTMALLAARRAREERDTAQSLAVAAQTVAEETVHVLFALMDRSLSLLLIATKPSAGSPISKRISPRRRHGRRPRRSPDPVRRSWANGPSRKRPHCGPRRPLCNSRSPI